MKEQAIDSMGDLQALMSRVSFGPSCLDMGWEWEAQWADRWAHHHGDDPTAGAFLIRCSFQRPDRDTGAISRGFGRWWYVEMGSTESAIIKTMFAAARMIVDHELMEAFKVDGRRPFDPHQRIGVLVGVAFDARYPESQS